MIIPAYGRPTHSCIGDPIMASFPNHLQEEAHVLVGEEGITLSFYFANTPHALIRSMEESIHKALTRMSLTIQKKTAASRGKKVKGKSNTVSDLIVFNCDDKRFTCIFY